MGADIYLPKPTPVEELLAAVITLKRRIITTHSNSWLLDTNKRVLLTAQDALITLTATEFALLLAFANAPNRILDTGVICDILFEKNQEVEVTKRAIENTISRLRKKIAETSLQNQTEKTIQSVWNQGYQLCLPLVVV